jgi:hypothetical protein
MKRLLLVVTLVVSVLVVALPVRAQDSTAQIEYNQTVEGEITAEAFEVAYTFTGKAGDVIVIYMVPTEDFSSLYDPTLVLKDAAGNILAQPDSHYSNALVAAALPADGEYTAVATRRDGADGTSTGKFALTVVQAQTITPGTPIQGSVTDALPVFYTFASKAPFVLTYERPAGTFYPEMVVSVISEGDLGNVGYIGGLYLKQSTLGISLPDDSRIEGPFIVAVQKASWDYYAQDVTADFSITFQQ